MKIQICKKFSKASKLCKTLNKTYPDDTIVIKSCISMCKVCKKKPVAKVKGKKLKAQSIAKLIDKIDEL